MFWQFFYPWQRQAIITPKVDFTQIKKNTSVFVEKHLTLIKSLRQSGAIWQHIFWSALAIIWTKVDHKEHICFFNAFDINQIIVAYWHHMTTYILVSFGSGKGPLPDSTKPLPEPMLTNHQGGVITKTWEQFHRNAQDTILYNEFENYTFKHTATYPMGQ